MVPIETFRVKSSAQFSDCGKYRYCLSRIWNTSSPAGMFVLLNPSKAGALMSDQTMGNCNNLAVQWGWGGFYMVNLYGFRATKPSDLAKARHPVGPENDYVIRKTARKAECVVLAWGNGHASRGREVCALLGDRTLYCIRRNAGGGYLHPNRINVEDYPEPVPL